MKIAVAGLTASGKSYHAKLLAQKLDLTYVSGSEILRQSFYGNTPLTDQFWASTEGFKFNQRRLKDHEIDRLVDQKLLEIVSIQDNIVVDSWTIPWLYKGHDLLKIAFRADLNTRTKMAYRSENSTPFTMSELKNKILKKDQESAKIYQTIYGFNIYDDSVFDIIIQIPSFAQSPEQTQKKLIRAIKSKWGGKINLQSEAQA